MNSFLLPPAAPRFLPKLLALRLPRSGRSGTAEITPQQYKFWATMAKQGGCLSADGSISQSHADGCLNKDVKKYPVPFHKLKRRMVYELTHRSHSTAADISGCIRAR